MARINEKEAAEKIINDAVNGYYEPRCVEVARCNTGNTEPVNISREDFNKTIAYILKHTDLVQASNGSYYIDPQSNESPIKEGEFLEPCIKGGQKILKNPKKRKMMKEIYRRI